MNDREREIEARVNDVQRLYEGDGDWRVVADEPNRYPAIYAGEYAVAEDIEFYGVARFIANAPVDIRYLLSELDAARTALATVTRERDALRRPTLVAPPTRSQDAKEGGE